MAASFAKWARPSARVLVYFAMRRLPGPAPCRPFAVDGWTFAVGQKRCFDPLPITDIVSAGRRGRASDAMDPVTTKRDAINTCLSIQDSELMGPAPRSETNNSLAKLGLKNGREGRTRPRTDQQPVAAAVLDTSGPSLSSRTHRKFGVRLFQKSQNSLPGL